MNKKNLPKCLDCKKIISHMSKARCKKCATKYRVKKYIGTYCEGNLQKLLNNKLQTYYWIGFLTADGSIDFNSYRLKFALATKDKSQVKKFANYICCKNIHNYKNHCEVQIQDKLFVPKIIKKYKFTKKKTYHPCGYQWLKKSSNNIFLSFLIGLIDGDGCVKHQSGRKDYMIQIKMHKNWLKYLHYIRNRLIKITKINIPKPYLVTDKKYSILVFANSLIINFIKQFINNHSLPILHRKWNKVPYNYISKYTTTRLNSIKVKKLLKKGFKQYKIAEILNLSNAAVSNLKRRK